MEGLESGFHHLELAFSSECVKSGGNFCIVWDESPVVGPEGHNFPGIVGGFRDGPIVDCRAPFLALFNDALTNLDTKVSDLSSFKLALRGVDSEIVVPEDGENPGGIIPEFFE